MCGIFGVISEKIVDKKRLKKLAMLSRERGRDSSGFIYFDGNGYAVVKADNDIFSLFKSIQDVDTNIIMGHSRLITNGLADNQPVIRDDLAVLHNGIIVNDDKIWEQINTERKYQIDSEVILALTMEHLESGGNLDNICETIFSKCIGVISCALVLASYGKLVLLSNNGSLHIGEIGGDLYFASEMYSLKQIGCDNIEQIKNSQIILSLPAGKIEKIFEGKRRTENLIPAFKNICKEEALLVYPRHNLRRCTRCILPETMPFIEFDQSGVCNYCRGYKKHNKIKPKEQLFELVKPYRKLNSEDCIVPFSGGRDSSYALHLIVNELGMNPIAYTYDWGMVTDLARRNISRMCAKLGVENIVIADDISKKRRNIAWNLNAWLKSPHLGMLSILTAGDKHFYRHVERVKKETDINLNIWAINPLEVTHFKSGFLGIKPNFETSKNYLSGISSQFEYHRKRFGAMSKSLGYFNSSLLDTFAGEYYRSIYKRKDYYHLFDYWAWNEKDVNDVLTQYDWELAPDTSCTWRIGDGTAAFYNYVYYTVAGFTEHDTFRSNQIREGQLSREEALRLADEENRPRYQNLRWYLDALNIDYESAITRINSIQRLY